MQDTQKKTIYMCMHSIACLLQLLDMFYIESNNVKSFTFKFLSDYFYFILTAAGRTKNNFTLAIFWHNQCFFLDGGNIFCWCALY